MKNRPVNEIRDFIFGNYYKAIGSTKEKSYYSMKRLKKELLFLANKLTKKCLIVVTLKNTINYL